MITNKEIAVIHLKNEIARDLDSFWDKMFKYHLQTLSAENRELKYLSTEISELINKVEAIQSEFLRPVNVRG